jgi:hypothetical protein
MSVADALRSAIEDKSKSAVLSALSFIIPSDPKVKALEFLKLRSELSSPD